MAELLNIESFISLSARFPVIDVRAPLEFQQGHIPGAVNIPLFDDHERKVVGTAYKQVNKEAAMYAGLDFAGKKLVKLAKEGERIAGKKRTLLVHCWRGGMRSKSMVWLFETLGLTCYLLEGGYKTYRAYVREVLERPLNLLVLGGRTGSGKTAILHHLGQSGEQVIDLEGLAHHKGSAFGALGEIEQPTTEQFENELCLEMLLLDPGKVTWIEDESRNVGRCVIPVELYSRMKESRMIFLDIPREQRALHLVSDYAKYEQEALKSCILKIEKRLGGKQTKEALESVDREDYFQTAMITLSYYDKAYMHSLEKNHEKYQILSSGDLDPLKNAERLMQYEKERGY
ncbi:MAG: tRNA 2-selenouridine(34) synthase MnmH [Bacteroidales bacterium]|nr:tRNA 2-selenouridine(34) synthase MnmH [Bacteroidales bacterium]